MERTDRSLELTSDEMRRLGYRVVDMIIEHVDSLGARRVANAADRRTLAARIGAEMPRAGASIDEVIERVGSDILATISHVDHPRFFAYVPSPGGFVGAMGDALAAGFNVFAGAWPVASAPAQVELAVIEWLCGLCGLPAGSGGVLVSGGSTANLTALMVARERLSEHARTRAVVYHSEQAHSSIGRALDVLGISPDRRRALGTDEAFRMDTAALAGAIERDRDEGAHPWCVVANGGATSTGAVDELAAIAELCRRDGLWLHVDAAYGGGMLASEHHRSALDGIGEADSVTLDPHKWLFQPFDIGCLLLRDESLLERTFQQVPAYLRDSARRTDEVNFRDRGIELTRPFRALKLWMTLQLFGTDAIAAAVERGVELAEVAERRLRENPLWSIDSPARLGIVCFRHRFDGVDEDAAHRRLTALLVEEGFAMLSTTELGGRVCLRLCTINPRTTDDDIHETIARLERHALAITN